MSGPLLLFVGVIYAAAAYYALPSRPGMCLALIGYTIGNVGLWWDLR
jgi:hypothetical protein